MAAIEGMKDQGYARWNNYTIKSINQHVKNNVRSYTHAKNVAGSSSYVISQNIGDEKLKQSEESLRKVMYLSCWGPN
ncbi:Amidase enhancer [Bienertia sinuspersici]